MPKIIPELVEFVKECRKLGYDDAQIKRPLTEAGWPMNQIDAAIAKVDKPLKKRTTSIASIQKIKNQVTVYLTDEIILALNKRAKKNMLNLNEQIEDILRRSTINSKKIKSEEDKVDDIFLKLFSRKNCGRPRKVA